MNGTTPADVLRVALWQATPLPPDTPDIVERNLERLRRAAATCAGRADLLITPEMFVCGYNIGARAAGERADAPDGPIAAAVSQICAASGLAVLYGCAELLAGEVYNAIRLVDSDGRLLATHHKTHLFGDLDTEMFAPGTVPAPVAGLGRWRLGLGICYEVEFPEVVRSLALRGADIVCVPTANMPEYDDVQRILLPARALENQVYVGYANLIGSEGDLAYGGLSEWIGPSGAVEALGEPGEHLVFGTADRDELTRSRAGWTYLADRRPELY